MSKKSVDDIAAWERERDLNAELLDAIDEARGNRWARRTEFSRQSDGHIRRRVVRSDGTVEHESTIPPDRLAVSAARTGTGLSQREFAKALGVSVRTVQDWEQGRREPSGAARTLLHIAAKHPNVLKEALRP